MQTIFCMFGFHAFEATSQHPYYKLGFHVRVCKCCAVTQACEAGLPWRNIANADMLDGSKQPKWLRNEKKLIK